MISLVRKYSVTKFCYRRGCLRQPNNSSGVPKKKNWFMVQHKTKPGRLLYTVKEHVNFPNCGESKSKYKIRRQRKSVCNPRPWNSRGGYSRLSASGVPLQQDRGTWRQSAPPAQLIRCSRKQYHGNHGINWVCGVGGRGELDYELAVHDPPADATLTPLECLEFRLSRYPTGSKMGAN